MTDDRPSLGRREFAKLVGVATLAAGGSTSVSTPTAAQTTQVGRGGYATVAPEDATAPAPPEYVTNSLSAPFPTSDWWSRLLTVDHAETLYSHPVVTEPTSSGLDVGYTDEWELGEGTGVDMGQDPTTAYMAMGETAYTPFEPDFTVGHTGTEQFDRSLVDDYGDWHVRYQMGSQDPSMTVTQAKGSPYLYVDYAGGGARLSFDTAPTVFADRGNVLGVSVDGHHYGLFAPAGTAWSGVGDVTVTNELDEGGSLTVALLPDDSAATLDRFAAHAHNVVTDTRIDWEYVEREDGEVVSEVRTTFQFSVTDRTGGGGTETITALYPHQHKNLHEGDSLLDGVTYDSPRGQMRATAGSSVTTALTYPGILPTYPMVGSLDPSTVERYVIRISTPDTAQASFDGSLAEEYGVPTLSSSVGDSSRLPFNPGKSPPYGSSYWTGLNLNRWSEAAATLDELGYQDRRDLVVDVIRRRLQQWFDIDGDRATRDSDLFFYDETWGTLVGHVGGFGTYAELNDHHFHYGYFVRGGAEIARHDDGWAGDYGGMVDVLVREYANPTRDDEMFPFLRNFSPYAGHSYASGINPFHLGNNQESSSEAINAYASLIRWGATTGRELDGHSIEDLGIFLYTHEAHATQEYWFDWDGQNHPEMWEREYAAVLWDAGYAHSTWWTVEAEDTYAINTIPATGASLYLGWDSDHASSVSDELIQLNGGEQFTRWPGTLLEFGAFADPSNTLDLFDDWESGDYPGGGRYSPDLSNSKLHTYTMLSALAELGSPTREVVADATFASVFIDDSGQRQYVAYNPEETATTVTFSDGQELSVDAGSMAVHPDPGSVSLDERDDDTRLGGGEVETFASGPGFGVVGTLAGLAGAGYLLGRRDDGE